MGDSPTLGIKKNVMKTKLNNKAMSNLPLYISELKANKQLFELGLISHVEKISKDIRAKYLYVTQKKDSQ